MTDRDPPHADDGDETSDSSGPEAAVVAARLERDRTGEAMQRLETALGMAAGGAEWLARIDSALERLEEVMSEEQVELNRPDALMAMIAQAHPRRLRPGIRSLRERYDDLIRQVQSLRAQLSSDADVDPNDVRHRAGWLTGALHHCRARQADIVFEAIELDLGTG